LTPWNELSLVGAEGTMLTVYGSAVVQWEVDGKIFVQAVLAVDPLMTEAILGLNFLSSCSVDLVRHVLITGDGLVITLCSQNKSSKKTVPALSVRVAANVRIPSYSEIEIMADVSGGYQENLIYALESVELKSNSVMVAHAAVRAGVSVLMCVMNPTD